MALKGEAVNYYKHMDYRRKHELSFSELSEKELSKLYTMDEYEENHRFIVLVAQKFSVAAFCFR